MKQATLVLNSLCWGAEPRIIQMAHPRPLSKPPTPHPTPFTLCTLHLAPNTPHHTLHPFRASPSLCWGAEPRIIQMAHPRPLPHPTMHPVPHTVPPMHSTPYTSRLTPYPFRNPDPFRAFSSVKPYPLDSLCWGAEPRIIQMANPRPLSLPSLFSMWRTQEVTQTMGRVTPLRRESERAIERERRRVRERTRERERKREGACDLSSVTPFESQTPFGHLHLLTHIHSPQTPRF